MAGGGRWVCVRRADGSAGPVGLCVSALHAWVPPGFASGSGPVGFLLGSAAVLLGSADCAPPRPGLEAGGARCLSVRPGSAEPFGPPCCALQAWFLPGSGSDSGPVEHLLGSVAVRFGSAGRERPWPGLRTGSGSAELAFRDPAHHHCLQAPSSQCGP